MNKKLVALQSALVMAGMIAAGTASAMGDRLPEDVERREWVRPGDVLQSESGAEKAPKSVEEVIAETIFIDDETISPADLKWKARVVAVFANTPQDPAFTQQLRAIEGGVATLAARDAVVVVDTDPAANGEWRRYLRPDGFSLVLIDKDGTIMLRKPVPWDIREISRAIDRFPLRRQEVGRSSLSQ